MHQTAWSIVSLWLDSGMYSHGFLIVPIAVWLVWDKRDQLAGLCPSAEYRTLWAVSLLGAGWFSGRVLDLLLLQQYAFVGLLSATLWTVLGTRIVRVLAFPLGFLLFAVPVGKGLHVPLMEFTADFTVAMLRLTGLPVVHDGLVFDIPTGGWRVIETCSGVRYLLASLTAGVLYAYMSYQRVWKRGLFILASILVPLVANGFRAYIIVMIAHLSHMKLAMGIDHFIYGWVFYTLIVFIMFLIGSIWRDSPTVPKRVNARRGDCREKSIRANAYSILAVLTVVSLWPLAAVILEWAGIT